MGSLAPSDHRTCTLSHGRTLAPSHRRTLAPSHRRTLTPSHLACFVLALTCLSVGAAETEIAPEAVLQHIKFLSSDELKGRGNGSPELETAGNYIAQQFKAVGLQPGGTSNEWFQPFQLIAGLTIGSGNTLSVSLKGRTANLALGTSYYPLSAPSNDDPARPSTDLHALPVVFAGYGLTVPGVYDDYARIDVSGKAVLIFSHEPQERDASSRLNGTRAMPQTTLSAKASVARNRGAKILLVVGDPSHRVDDAPYSLFGSDPDAEDLGIPVLRVRREEMQPLLDGWQLDATARQIDGDLMPRSRDLPDGKVEYVEHIAKNRRTVRNVIGVLPGSDPVRAKEAIVIGAHYDHVGLGGRLSVSPERAGEIHNGADDNASGTASIIEIARAAVANQNRFPRTLIFVAFAGEERGLLGSAAYVNEPRIPVESTIAMLNLDMIGRANGAVDVSGLDAAPSMEADLTAAVKASASPLKIKREGPGAGRSDDYNFLTRRIPAINFFTGFHADYHRPGDDWEKIDAKGTSQVARLALELAAALANRASRPEFVSTQ
jgi:peptidase M28-like protein